MTGALEAACKALWPNWEHYDPILKAQGREFLLPVVLAVLNYQEKMPWEV